MNKNTKIILWASAGVFALTGTILLVKYLNKDNKNPDTAGKKTSDQAADKIITDVLGANETTTQTKIASDQLPFKLDRGNNRGGSEGLRVAQYQLMLNYAFGTALDIDGKFGQAVKEATNSNVPVYIYPCNKGTALLGTSVCDISKRVWDYVLAQVLKKGGGSIAGFDTYTKNNLQFANLARNKYKL